MNIRSTGEEPSESAKEAAVTQKNRSKERFDFLHLSFIVCQATSAVCDVAHVAAPRAAHEFAM